MLRSSFVASNIATRLMNIRAKLTLGVGVLVLAILLLCAVALGTVFQLKADTNNILKANYNSLQYCKNMLQALDSSSNKNTVIFEKNLVLQEANITELGEANLTEKIRLLGNQWIDRTIDTSDLSILRNALLQAMTVNMQAIYNKSDIANKRAETYIVLMAAVAFVSTIIGVLLWINIPRNTAKPIQQLSHSLQQIANNNYAERLQVKGSGEFQTLAIHFNEMAEKLQQYNNSVLADVLVQKQRLETLVHNIIDPVVGLNNALEISFVNAEAARVLNTLPKELIGVSAVEKATENKVLEQWIAELLTTSPAAEHAATWQHQVGSQVVYYERRIVPVYLPTEANSKPPLTGYLILLKNVTQHKLLDAAKTSFIATVSHELKTPISSIQLGLQLLHNTKIGALNTEQEQLLQSIQDDTVRLLQTTSNLLAITQMESGSYALNLALVPVQNLIKLAVNAVQIQADYKNIQLIVKAISANAMVFVDAEKSVWVLTNIISNAVKYSPEYTTVCINTQIQNAFMEVSVVDEGVGISAEHLQHIFSKYYRVPNTPTEGSGLGLAICHTIIKQQGGNIYVQSTVGKGSTFTVQLPTQAT